MADEKGRIEAWVGIGKELVVLGRDGVILLVFVLLLFAPKSVNRILRDAGFTKGSLAGLTWEKEIEAAAEQTKEVGESVTALTDKLAAFGTSLAELESQAETPAVQSSIRDARAELGGFMADARVADNRVKASLYAQQQLVAQVSPEKVESEGWLYLGKITEDKTKWVSGRPITISPIDPTFSAGARLTIRDASYLRGDISAGQRSSGRVLSVLRVGDAAEVLEKDFSHARGGGWFVWARVKGIP